MGCGKDESVLNYFMTKAALVATEVRREDPRKEG